jgi:hypothetical protein
MKATKKKAGKAPITTGSVPEVPRTEVGRPPVFKTVEEFHHKVEEYFRFIQGEKSGRKWIRKPEPPTVTGLALFVGFESRQSFYDYEKDGQFSYTVKKARLRVENAYEKGLHAAFPAGSIFALKNFGWADKTEVTNNNVNWNAEPTEEEARRIKEALLKSI